MQLNTIQKKCLLLFLGYDPGTINDAVNMQMVGAVKKFQADYGGLTIDGDAGAKTCAALVEAVINGLPAKAETDKMQSGTVWDRAKYFKRAEFRCTCGKCGGFPVEPTDKLVDGCERLRSEIGVPLFVVDRGGSGIRCKAHNAEVGGATNSNHLYGKAADIHSDIATPEQLYQIAEKILGKTGELGLYKWGIHFAPEGSYSRFVG